MPEEDLGIILVGQLPTTGALYALPHSFYDYDLLLHEPPCDSSEDCAERSLPPSAWKGDRPDRCPRACAATMLHTKQRPELICCERLAL